MKPRQYVPIANVLAAILLLFVALGTVIGRLFPNRAYIFSRNEACVITILVLLVAIAILIKGIFEDS